MHQSPGDGRDDSVRCASSIGARTQSEWNERINLIYCSSIVHLCSSIAHSEKCFSKMNEGEM